MSELITEIDILDEAKNNFLTYASEVLTDRAIPSAEDGLLSVHRKIIWTMEELLKMNAKSKTKKSASIVGSTLASAYFHGDASCYGALCKLSQDYLMRYPLIIGQGQLGTQESNGMQASARYTEAKPSPFADLMMQDFKKKTVDVKETYNGEYMEPVVLPSLFPNAIVNGREAIGVSMSSNTLPHNLNEVCDGIIAYLNNNNLTIDELMTYIKGPDFPLGGTVINEKDIKEAFSTGHSKVSLKVRGDYEIKGKDIIFTSIPYRTYRDKIRSQIMKYIDELDEVLENFRDESNVGKNRLIFTVKSGVDNQKALNRLFEKTDLQTTLSYNMNFIVNGTPKMCSMIDLIDAYCNHQDNVIKRSTKFDLDKAEARLHIVEGLLIAVANIDTIIKLIRNAENRAKAGEALKSNYPSLSDIQIKAILDMKLASLTKLDGFKLEEEQKELVNKIAEFKEILTNKEKRDNILINKIKDMKKKYGDERRTKLCDINIKHEKKEVPVEDCIVTLYSDGTLKRSKTNAKKGRNTFTATPIKTIKANTMNEIFIFSDAGKVYKEEISNIPEDKRLAAKNICTAIGNEKPIYILLPKENIENKSVCFFTKNGMYKKTLLSEYTSLKRAKKGAAAIKLKPEDELREILILDEDDTVILTTKNGYCLKISNNDVRPIGRACAGVKGIKLSDGDELTSACKSDSHFIIVSADNKIKKVDSIKVPLQGRGSKGKCLSEKGICKIISIKGNETLHIYGTREQNHILATEITDHPSKCLKEGSIVDVLALS